MSKDLEPRSDKQLKAFVIVMFFFLTFTALTWDHYALKENQGMQDLRMFLLYLYMPLIFLLNYIAKKANFKWLVFSVLVLFQVGYGLLIMYFPTIF